MSDIPKLTDRQKEIFNWMVSFTVEHFYQPSIREACEHFGFKSPNGIECYMRTFRAAGLIRPSARSRAIEFLRREPLS